MNYELLTTNYYNVCVNGTVYNNSCLVYAPYDHLNITTYKTNKYGTKENTYYITNITNSTKDNKNKTIQIREYMIYDTHIKKVINNYKNRLTKINKTYNYYKVNDYTLTYETSNIDIKNKILSLLNDVINNNLLSVYSLERKHYDFINISAHYKDININDLYKIVSEYGLFNKIKLPDNSICVDYNNANFIGYINCFNKESQQENETDIINFNYVPTKEHNNEIYNQKLKAGYKQNNKHLLFALCLLIALLISLIIVIIIVNIKRKHNINKQRTHEEHSYKEIL